MSNCRCISQASNQRGLTILELMLVTVLFGLFVGSAYDATIIGLRATNTANDRETIRMQMIRALDRLTREAALATHVDYAQDAQFQFDTASVNNVNYSYASGTLTRSDANTSSTTLVQNLTSFDFNYRESNDTNASPQSSCDYTSSCGSRCCRSEVRVVDITMTATKNQETITVTGSAFIRNL